MSEEKGMVSQEAVTATSADAGSIMPLAADLSRTQDVTTVSEVSTINSTDQFYMNQSGKFVQVDYSKLADAILGKISSKTYSLDQGTKTLIAAINELNSKTLKTSNPQDFDVDKAMIPGIYGTNNSSPSTMGWKNYPINDTGYLLVELNANILSQKYISYQGILCYRAKYNYDDWEWSNWGKITMTQVSQ